MKREAAKSGETPEMVTVSEDATGKRFAIVVANWHTDATYEMVHGAREALIERGADENDIRVYPVPGAFEIPLAVLRACESDEFDAIVALGCIIRGETPHFDFVASEVSRGITLASLETGTPVGFGVLTTENPEQALERADRKRGNKGAEAALAALAMRNLLPLIDEG
jgi:6,7-dimethyl-8-ribityllumazine synthase